MPKPANSAARAVAVLAGIFILIIGVPYLIYNSVPYTGPVYTTAAFVPFVIYPDYSLGLALVLLYFGVLIVGLIAIVKFPKKYTVRG